MRQRGAIRRRRRRRKAKDNLTHLERRPFVLLEAFAADAIVPTWYDDDDDDDDDDFLAFPGDS